MNMRTILLATAMMLTVISPAFAQAPDAPEAPESAHCQDAEAALADAPDAPAVPGAPAAPTCADAEAEGRSALQSGPLTIWTDWNMGPDSGLDADTVDGLQGGDIMGAIADVDARVDQVSNNVFSLPSTVEIFTGTTGVHAQAQYFKPGYGGSGAWFSTNEGYESGGFFANGDTAAIWSPGDGDLLAVFDEDDMYSGNPRPTPDFRIDGSGGTFARYFVSTSTEAVKENIETLTDAMDKVQALRGVSYDLKETPMRTPPR